MKKKTKIFTQNCGTYSDQILVICGATKKETYAYLKKVKANVDFTEWVLNDFSDWENRTKKQNYALFCWHEEVEGCVLFLKPLKDSWEYWETLMHECHHVTFHLAKKKMFQDEIENQAYLFEYLFRSIRRKICGLD